MHNNRPPRLNAGRFFGFDHWKTSALIGAWKCNPLTLLLEIVIDRPTDRTDRLTLGFIELHLFQYLHSSPSSIPECLYNLFHIRYFLLFVFVIKGTRPKRLADVDHVA